MALKRYSKGIDGTIPVKALLYNDEELLASQDGVGIYDGLQKSPLHQSGTVHATTHRLFYFDANSSLSHSFVIDLSLVTQTEYYAGLFKSSPKVTLHLFGTVPASDQSVGEDSGGFESWECEVCAFRNTPGLSPTATRICGLCGVPRTAVPSSAPLESSRHLSSSLPSSGLASSTSLASGSSRSQESISCPACTFLNHSSLRTCEICGTGLPRPSRQMKSAPSSRPTSPELVDEDVATMTIKVSFRKGGDKAFYAVLKRALKGKAWEDGLNTKSNVNNTESDTKFDQSNVGISGILRTVESSAQGRETHMKDALHDLEALMVKAKDMVRLAAELNEKLTASSSVPSGYTLASRAGSPAPSGPSVLASSEPEEATFIRSSLSQLGLQMANTPVTLDMMKDERKWNEELARELARVLQGSFSSQEGKAGMMKDRGIIALDEVWGGWNRARGVALIPPSTFLQVVPLLPNYTEPLVQPRTFASGLMVLHTPPYARGSFATRLSSFLVMDGPKTIMEIAAVESLSLALVKEMVEAGESDGDFCRDDGNATITGGGSGTGVEIRWWPNLFLGYTWDGQV